VLSQESKGTKKAETMGCLLTIIALLTPRVLMLFIWLLTDWFRGAFESRIWPVLGFLFMPYTTLAYMAAMLKNNHSVSGGWLVLLIVAVIADVSHWGGGGRKIVRIRRRRKP